MPGAADDLGIGSAEPDASTSSDGGADLSGALPADLSGTTSTDLGATDLRPADLAGTMSADLAGMQSTDLAHSDLAHSDLSHGDLNPDLTTGSTGVITGGACSSGATGATAFRVRWAGSSGQSAYPVYEVSGLPDKSRGKAGVYGYQIGFTSSFVDPFLAQGGLQLDGSDFVDLELSTVGVTTIRSATLAILGRSYNTTTSGSFNWQTFDGTGATTSNLVSNGAPYEWYVGDMTTEISPSDNKILIRIKAGPSSSSLVVNRIELCLDAS